MVDGFRRGVGWTLVLGCAALMAWLLWTDLTAATAWQRGDLTKGVWDRERVNIDLGLWSTRFMIAALAVSPVSDAMREPSLKRLRRGLGLAAFAFAAAHAVHYVVYVGLWPDHLHILVRRPYLLVGVIALALFVPLALSSNAAAPRRLGPRRWRLLHRLVYPAAVLVVAHELMAWSNLFGEVGLHALCVAALLAWRIRPRGKPCRRPTPALADGLSVRHGRGDGAPPSPSPR